MKVINEPKLTLLWSTPDPRRVIAIAARMTYSAQDVETLAENLEEPEIAKSVKAILERRHYSVLRHVVLMFTVSGVSRAFSHQLVRHTAGHAFEQRSQHYRTEKDPSFVEPDTIDGHAAELYRAALDDTESTYHRLIEMGVPKDDARFILPNATETQLVWTVNLDALLNFIKARACRVNTPEIMRVAVMARKIAVGLIPELSKYAGPPCLTQGMCFEGDKFYKQCNLPWASPTVLWRPDFPKNIEVVGVGGRKASLQVVDLLQDIKEVFDDGSAGS